MLNSRMLNNHWDVKNTEAPVSREQFITLVEKFHQSMEEVLGTQCQMEVKALNQRAFIHYGSLLDEWSDYVLQSNEEATFFRAATPIPLTQDTWKQAAQINVSISPIDYNATKFGAWGTMTFDKQGAPQKVSFDVYRHPNGLDIERATHKLPVLKNIARLALKCVR